MYWVQGVWSVAELIAECIVAQEHRIRMLSNFHIFESMPLSDLCLGHSSFELHGQSLREV